MVPFVTNGIRYILPYTVSEIPETALTNPFFPKPPGTQAVGNLQAHFFEPHVHRLSVVEDTQTSFSLANPSIDFFF